MEGSTPGAATAQTAAQPALPSPPLVPAAPQPTPHLADAAGGPTEEDADAASGSGTDTDDDGTLIRQARDARVAALQERRKAAAAAAPAPRGGGRSRAGGITMKVLIEEGLLWPGDDVLSVDYKQQQTLASLTHDGRIRAHIGGQERFFESPSAFSIFLKRLVNPGRKADDGWKTVKFGGKYLEHYKMQLAMRRFPQAGQGGDAPGPAARQPPSPARASTRPASARRQAASDTEDDEDEEDDYEEFEDEKGDEYHVAPRAKRARTVQHSRGGSPGEAAKAAKPSAARQQQPRSQQQQRGTPPKGPKAPFSQQMPRGQETSASVAALEHALRQRHTGGAVLANGARGGELFTPQSGASSDFARPRREPRPPPRLHSHTLDEHQMVACEEYRGQVGSGAPGAQPFAVAVSHAALLAMDFHAHLCDHEVIGMLGGTFDAAARSMRILRAFPVREMPIEGGGSIDVEMDPVEEAATRAAIREEHGMQCVGWYHSHPSFTAMPSVIDIANQARQQIAHRAEDGTEPYVAAIVAPYDPRLTTPASAVAWFRVEHPLGRLPPVPDPLAAGCKAVRVAVALDAAAPEPAEEAHLRELPSLEWPALARRYAGMAARSELGAEWRGGLSCTHKLRASLAARLPPAWPDDDARLFAATAADGALAAFDAAVSGGQLQGQQQQQGGQANGQPAQAAGASAMQPQPGG